MDAEDMDTLKDKKSTFANLHFVYDAETLSYLKKQFARTDSLYLIAKEDNYTFVAFCSLDSDWWEPRHFFLREIFVMPAYQGQGIGKMFIEKCVEHAKRHNALAIVTQTAFENQPMQKLCEKSGFSRWDNPQWKKDLTYKLVLS